MEREPLTCLARACHLGRLVPKYTACLLAVATQLAPISELRMYGHLGMGEYRLCRGIIAKSAHLQFAACKGHALRVRRLSSMCQTLLLCPDTNGLGDGGPQLIRELMDAAVQVGLTVMRMWSHGVTPEFATQTAPGVYNEAMLRGLDYAMDEARKRNIKVGWAALCLDTTE